MPVLSTATANTFRVLSRLRHKRCFHPRGVGFAATLTPEEGLATGAQLFDAGEPVPAIVRVSRSLGLPEWMGDPFGIAIRAPHAYGSERHQDFLLVSSARPPVARHLLLPTADLCGAHYSSLLPYRLASRLIVIGAAAAPRCEPGVDIAELSRRPAAGLAFEIRAATGRGDWATLGRLDLEERLPAEEVEEAGFDPANTGGGLELAGFINRLRRPAYRGSQLGRGAQPGHTPRTPATEPLAPPGEAPASGERPAAAT